MKDAGDYGLTQISGSGKNYPVFVIIENNFKEKNMKLQKFTTEGAEKKNLRFFEAM